MKKMKLNLSQQLLIITAIVFIIIAFSLSFILPKILVPIYEKNVYSNLTQPLNFIRNDIDDNIFDGEVAYIFVESNGKITASRNLTDIISVSNFSDIANKITKSYGKFKYDGHIYYYSTLDNRMSYVIAITNSNYIKEMKSDMLWKIIPLVLITTILVAVLLLLWSNLVVRRIKNINRKITNIGKKEENVEKIADVLVFEDELSDLDETIDTVKTVLYKQEEYRNELYQNISHDFKTPITVIKSYIEALKDGVEDNEKVLKVIEKQTKILENKIKILLNLNKLEYLRYNNEKYEEINVMTIINNSVDKFKHKKNKLEWIVNNNKNNIKYLGTNDLWESIIDNILSNFIRYADTKIEITITEDEIILYNDGEKIEEDLLENIFMPYKKGVKGEFGLGLSIVKKSLDLLGYKIIITNKEKGVEFKIIKE